VTQEPTAKQHSAPELKFLQAALSAQRGPARTGHQLSSPGPTLACALHAALAIIASAAR